MSKTADTASDATVDEPLDVERHVVHEPHRIEDGVQAGFAVVEVGDDVIAFESFLRNEEAEAVLTQDPITVEKEAALLAIKPLNRIFRRDYMDDE